jgi:hypothetical protein
MSVVSGRLVLPLIDCTLNKRESMNVATGIRIESLASSIVDELKENKVFSSGYGRALDSLKIGLVIEPTNIHRGDNTKIDENIRTAQFVARCLNLATEVPIDAPFWFDVSSDGEIHGRGRVITRIFRSGPRYTYPLDEGRQVVGIRALRRHLLALIVNYSSDLNIDRLGRALEFAMVGLQTWHIPTRLVNQVTYMETLFSSGTSELSYQLASRISWYLASWRDAAGREHLFDQIKEIYNARSLIVHGGSSQRLTAARLRILLAVAEMTNAAIFRKILLRNHVAAFASNDRDIQLKKLGLGIMSVFR